MTKRKIDNELDAVIVKLKQNSCFVRDFCFFLKNVSEIVGNGSGGPGEY